MSARWLIAWLVFAGWAGTAQAQFCGASMNGNISFGTVNPPDQPPTSVAGQVNVWCNGATAAYVRACISLGAPLDASYDPRYMNGPTPQRMAYNVYTDPGFTQIWGSDTSSVGRPLAVDVKVQSWGGGDATVAYYARVPSQELPAGHYWVNYNGADTAVRVYGHNGAPPDCSSSMPKVADFSFGVTADVAADCTVSATTLDFGATGDLALAVRNANGSISIKCAQGVNYTVALNAGQGSGATVAQRKLTLSGGSDTLMYQLYRDAGRLQPWGDGSGGTSTLSGSGSGSVVTHTVYGSLPVQSMPPPGVYADLITVTVTY